MIISIDSGKYATKAMSQSKRIYFPTRISSNPAIDPAGNTFHLEYKGSTYLIGEQAELQSFDISKAETVHKLSAFAAITQLIEFDYHVQLALGCPMNIYKNKQLREEYKVYMQDDQRIRILVNGTSYSFFIDNILILPESAGVVYLYPSLFKAKRVSVIDLGGLNMNFCIYDNYIPQLSSMFTLNLGGNELQTDILNTLNTEYGIVLTSLDIPYIISQGGLKLKGKIDNDSILLLNSLLDNYLHQIIQETMKNGYNLDTMDVVFIGGTSKLLEAKIRQFVTHSFIPDNAEWVNAEGFYKIGEMKYGPAE